MSRLIAPRRASDRRRVAPKQVVAVPCDDDRAPSLTSRSGKTDSILLELGYCELCDLDFIDIDLGSRISETISRILDTNPQLFFHLQQQRLIELIRNGKVEEALEFAQEELAPRGEENQSFLEELERTVALLAFEDVSNCPVGELLDISQRLKTASEVNAAILTSQSHEKDPKLPSLLKMLVWAQTQLDEKAAYPRIKDLSTATLEDPAV
ncbi:LOW QUALITY PROTEIN: glucose-induced degradation protein 8 homolog [Carica papaya]|uniref:LOW QUALITY PROTEIN: glucose-induced degradation protein 8 homolog n=1 Tax=Carica papaya TaxID=3649 RepID=UPI000B8C7C4D|nr:LOW QUALITY PROTEIN: glucose-induced degradation protein 8 homolog [Carica papaya]